MAKNTFEPDLRQRVEMAMCGTDTFGLRPLQRRWVLTADRYDKLFSDSSDGRYEDADDLDHLRTGNAIQPGYAANHASTGPFRRWGVLWDRPVVVAGGWR